MQPLPLMVDIDMGEMNMLDTAMVDTDMVDTDIVDTEVNMLQGWPFVRALIYTQLKNVTQPPVVTNMRYVKLLKGSSVRHSDGKNLVGGHDPPGRTANSSVLTARVYISPHAVERESNPSKWKYKNFEQ